MESVNMYIKRKVNVYIKRVVWIRYWYKYISCM